MTGLVDAVSYGAGQEIWTGELDKEIGQVAE